MPLGRKADGTIASFASGVTPPGGYVGETWVAVYLDETTRQPALLIVGAYTSAELAKAACEHDHGSPILWVGGKAGEDDPGWHTSADPHGYVIEHRWLNDDPEGEHR